MIARKTHFKISMKSSKTKDLVLQAFPRLWTRLPKHLKLKGVVAAFAIIFSALFEMAGVGIIAPTIPFAIDPAQSSDFMNSHLSQEFFEGMPVGRVVVPVISLLATFVLKAIVLLISA